MRGAIGARLLAGATMIEEVLAHLRLGRRALGTGETREGDWTAVAGRAIDGLDEANVLQTVEAGGLGDAILQDGAREVRDLGGEGIARLERQRLPPPATAQ